LENRLTHLEINVVTNYFSSCQYFLISELDKPIKRSVDSFYYIRENFANIFESFFCDIFEKSNKLKQEIS